MLVVSRGDVRHHLSTLLALLPDYYQHRPCHRHIHHLLGSCSAAEYCHYCWSLLMYTGTAEPVC